MPTATDRDAVIQQNMGLVHACAHRLKGRGIEYEDLFQAGCMGLVKATDAFDYDRGVRFSTYAVPVILGEMRRLFRDGGTVKVSRTLKELSLKCTRTKERLSVQLGREPTVGELAAEMGIAPDEVAEALSAAAPALSLTAAGEDGTAQIDLPIPSPEEQLSESISLRQVLDLLDEKDQTLIRMRYFGGKTQTVTAKALGMTQVQVSRREKKILLQLRQLLD